MERLRRSRPDDAVLSPKRRPPTNGRVETARRRPGVDRRSARRHPRVRRGSQRTGRFTSPSSESGVPTAGAVALPALGTDARAPGEPPSIPPATGRAPGDREPDPSAGRGARRRRGARGRARRDGIGRSEGDGDRPRRGRRLPALGRTVRVGLRRAGRRGRWPRACTAPGSTAARWSTTGPTRTCPTCSSAVPNWPTPALAAAAAAST